MESIQTIGGQSHTMQCNGANLATAANFTQTYAYDSLNRLTGVADTGGNSGRSFSYDAFGNIWSPSNSGFPLSVSTPTASSAVNASNNRLANANYDGAGNLLDIPNFCTNCLQYDAENRVTAYTKTGTTYAYDPLGNRVQKKANGVTVTYVNDIFGQPVSEYTSGTPAPLPCDPCFLSPDHLGSTRMVTDIYGPLVSRHDYLPFGEEIPGRLCGTARLGAVRRQCRWREREVHGADPGWGIESGLLPCALLCERVGTVHFTRSGECRGESLRSADVGWVCLCAE